MPRDQFPNRSAGGSARSFVPIVKSDADQPEFFQYVWIGTGGILVIAGEDDVPVSHSNIPDGVLLPISPKRILAATTCQNMVGWL